MVANPSQFDAGTWLLLVILGSFSLVIYPKIGALMLVVSCVSFLIAGLVVLTGYDLVFFQKTNPVNMTITTTNGTQTTTTTYHNIVPSNQTNYLVGNGQFPEQGTSQLILGISLLIMSVISGIIFLDRTLKGELIKG